MIDERERLIPGIVDARGNPLPMPHDHGRWQREWYPQVLAHRVRAKRTTEGSDKASLLARAAHKALCRQPGGNGRLYLLNTFGWILEPRGAAGLKRLPFITWPRQVDLIDEEEDAKATPGPSPDANCAVIKARDVGGTWIDVTDSEWEWMHTDDYHALIIGSDFDKVASWDDVKAYFFKLKFLMQSVPDWLWPAGFAGFVPRSPHAKEGILINPANGSTISASTTTPDAGRGDRRAKVTLEEAGEQDDFDAKYNNLQNVTDHVKVVSSAHVRHGYGLYNLIHGKDGYTPPRTFYFRSRDVPGRDDAWHRNKKATMKDDEYAREVEIDWLAGSGEQSFPRAALIEPGRYPYVPGWQVYVGFDDGYDQDTALSGWQIDMTRGRLRCIFAYANSKVPMEFYGQLCIGELSGKYAWDEEDRALAAWFRDMGVLRHAVWYGDRHGDNTDLSSGISPFQKFQEVTGYYVITNPDPDANNLKTRLDKVNEHLPIMDFDLGHGAPRVLEALRLSRHPRRRDSAQPVTEVKGVIHHGKESHYRSTVDSVLMNLSWKFQGLAPAGAPERVGIGSGFDPLRHQGRRFRKLPGAPIAVEADIAEWSREHLWTR